MSCPMVSQEALEAGHQVARYIDALLEDCSSKEDVLEHCTEAIRTAVGRAEPGGFWCDQVMCVVMHALERLASTVDWDWEPLDEDDDEEDA